MTDEKTQREPDCTDEDHSHHGVHCTVRRAAFQDQVQSAVDKKDADELHLLLEERIEDVSSGLAEITSLFMAIEHLRGQHLSPIEALSTALGAATAPAMTVVVNSVMYMRDQVAVRQLSSILGMDADEIEKTLSNFSVPTEDVTDDILRAIPSEKAV